MVPQEKQILGIGKTTTQAEQEGENRVRNSPANTQVSEEDSEVVLPEESNVFTYLILFLTTKSISTGNKLN